MSLDGRYRFKQNSILFKHVPSRWAIYGWLFKRLIQSFQDHGTIPYLFTKNGQRVNLGGVRSNMKKLELSSCNVSYCSPFLMSKKVTCVLSMIMSVGLSEHNLADFPSTVLSVWFNMLRSGTYHHKINAATYFPLGHVPVHETDFQIFGRCDLPLALGLHRKVFWERRALDEDRLGADSSIRISEIKKGRASHDLLASAMRQESICNVRNK